MKITKGNSLKLVMATKGSAGIYSRRTLTMEWDITTAVFIRESDKLTYQFDNKKPLLHP